MKIGFYVMLVLNFGAMVLMLSMQNMIGIFNLAVFFYMLTVEPDVRRYL